MEKYFKMPAGFNGGAEWFGNAMRDDMTASDVLIDAAVHAINSHDELVAMNKELLAALECAEGFVYEVSEKTGFGQVHTLKVIRSAIAKAKAVA